jgi:hypothetical protein
MADHNPFLPSYPPAVPRFKGIPTPEQLGMGVSPFKAAGMLRKAAKHVHTPLKGTGIASGSGVRSTGGKTAGNTGAKK